MPTRKRLSIGLSALAALSLAGGIAAQFTTSTVSAPQQIGTGTLALVIDNVSPVTWTDDISNLAAGDSVTRFLDLRNSGSLPISGVSVSQTSTLGPLLNAPSDISLVFESCSVAWDYATGTCAGTKTTVTTVGSVRGWTGTALPMTGFGSFEAGAIAHLKLTTSLAAGATNEVQHATGSISYTFSADQRTGFTWGDTGNGGVAPGAGGSSPVGNGGSAPVVVPQVDPAGYITSPATVLTNAPGSYTSQSYAIDKLDRIYATGGNRSFAPTVGTATARYDIASGVWTTLPAMPVARYGPSAVGGDGKLYLPGGQGASGAIATVQIFDPVAGTWSTGKALPTAMKANAAITGADGNIYLIGSTYGTSGAIVKYDISTGDATTVGSLTSPGGGVSATLGADGKIYTAGVLGAGRSGADSSIIARPYVESFDPKTGISTILPDLPRSLSGMALSTGSDGNLYGYGGVNGSWSTSVYKYDVSTQKWSVIRSIATPSWYGSTGLHDGAGRIYVVGGQTKTVINGTTTQADTNAIYRFG